MATFNAGTVQASVEIDQSKLTSSVSEAVSQVKRMGTEGEAAGKQAGQQTGQGFAASIKDSVGGGLDGIKEKLSGALSGGAGIAAAAGGAVGLALVGSLMQAVNFEPMRAKLTAQLGLTQQESARIGGVAGKLFGAAYGEGMEDVNDALRSVIQNIGGMRNASQADLQSITGQVMSLSQAFDQDLGATTRAVGQMMKTGMAKDAQEALDIIARGFQVGADKSEDFLDTLNEYGTQFRKLGIDGKDATGLISQGLQAGARDADIVADAFKEFSIRAVDGSKLTSDSLTQLGLNAQRVSADVAAGGERARQATDLVLDSLRGVKDPAEKAAIAVGLFGTQSEDLGKALDALDLTTAASELGEVAGVSQEVDRVMGDTAAGGLTSIFRGFQLLGDTIGTALLPILKPIITGFLTLTGIITNLVTGIADLPGPILLVGGALVGWLIITSITPAITAMATSLGVAAVAVRGFLVALGPIGAIAAIAGAAFTALSFLMDSTSDSQATVQAATDRWAALVSTLDQVSGAVTDATRAQLTAQAQQTGMLDTLTDLGVSMKDYIDASAGVAGGQERLAASTQTAAEKVLSQSDAYKNLGEGLITAIGGQDAFIAAMESGDISAIQQKVDAYAESVARTSGNVSDATTIQSNFAAAVAEGQSPLQALGGILNLSGSDADGFATEADKAAQRAKALGTDAGTAADGVGTLGGAADTATTPMENLRTATAGLTTEADLASAAVDFMAASLDAASGHAISMEQTQNNAAAAIRGVGGASRDVQQAMIDEQTAASDLKTAIDEHGESSTEARDASLKYADAVDNTKDATDRQFDANVKARDAALKVAAAMLTQTDASGKLVGGADAATGSLQNAKDAFIAAQPEADRLSGKAQATADKLYGIPKDTVAKIAEQGASGVQQAAGNVASALHGIPANTQANISTNAVSVIGALDTVAMQLRGLDGQNSTVTVTRRVVGDMKLVQADGGHIQKAAAGLRLLGGRGVSQHRDGDGQGVTWAEGITGEEFYISMKPGQEQRNRKFLSEAAVKLGGRASFNQAPDVTSAAAGPSATGSASRVVTVGSVSIGRFDDADRFFDRMAWEQLG